MPDSCLIGLRIDDTVIVEAKAGFSTSGPAR